MKKKPKKRLSRKLQGFVQSDLEVKLANPRSAKEEPQLEIKTSSFVKLFITNSFDQFRKTT